MHTAGTLKMKIKNEYSLCVPNRVFEFGWLNWLLPMGDKHVLSCFGYYRQLGVDSYFWCTRLIKYDAYYIITIWVKKIRSVSSRIVAFEGVFHIWYTLIYLLSTKLVTSYVEPFLSFRCRMISSHCKIGIHPPIPRNLAFCMQQTKFPITMHISVQLRLVLGLFCRINTVFIHDP